MKTTNLIFLLFPLVATANTSSPREQDARRVVDAFQGRWAQEVSAALPGDAKPVRFRALADCRKIASGAGVSCAISGAGGKKLGKVDESCLIASDPEGTGVHMMCVSNMGEVHDHRGHWKDDKTLEFEPFRATTEGKPSTETILASWSDDKHMTISSVTEVDGAKTVFEFRGTRR